MHINDYIYIFLFMHINIYIYIFIYKMEAKVQPPLSSHTPIRTHSHTHGSTVSKRTPRHTCPITAKPWPAPPPPPMPRN